MTRDRFARLLLGGVSCFALTHASGFAAYSLDWWCLGIGIACFIGALLPTAEEKHNG